MGSFQEKGFPFCFERRKEMSEKMAGIFALNVINEKDYMEINGKRIERKEYNGVPILTSWDIAKIHGKETKRINEQFKRNYKRFEEGADYFWVTREYFSEPPRATLKNIPNNIKQIPVYTRRGYIKLTKTFSDDLSWKIQDILIDVYFNTEKFIEAVQNGEIEIRRKEEPTEFEMRKLENESEMIRLEKAKLLERLANNITNEKMKNTLIIHSANTVTGQLLLEPEKAERRSYTAGEISEMLKERYDIDITVNMLGRISTKYGMKTEEYGYLAYDKAKTSVKQVETFRYFENAVPKFYEIIKEHYSVKYL